eukprot:CAMPEP_0119289698 /NCGR_PEP_ID=MMETSP1329-20130426/39470_1 /TAXON_ID=114041 /ORGANISM="Genus nov. species nov., Strain RCC1024" /LENGTH=230 /DNA_ID=CAMNT_0007290505 /DNA_START=299 /DNA_END=987 /DNA_ORIENTATION=+
MRITLLLAAAATSALRAPLRLSRPRRDARVRYSTSPPWIYRRVKPPVDASVAGTAALVAGATVGGGFLAIPRATKGLGVGPCALGLGAAWAWLGLASLALAEAALRATEEAEKRFREDPGAPPVDAEGLSVVGVAYEATTRGDRRGPLGHATVLAAYVCFGLATAASLGSQYAKCNELLSVVWLGPGRLCDAARVGAVAGLFYAVAFARGDRAAAKAGYACTLAMLVAEP